MTVRVVLHAHGPDTGPRPFHRNGWVYEEKVDGWRMLAYKDRDRVRLVNRNGRDHTRRFRDIAAEVAKFVGARRRGCNLRPAVAVAVRLAARARPGRDRHAADVHGVRSAAPRRARALTGRPLRERRARLADAVADSDLVLPVRRLARNGFEAWSEVIARDYEGYVAKDESSLYDAGLTRRWLKVKQKGSGGSARRNARRSFVLIC